MFGLFLWKIKKGYYNYQSFSENCKKSNRKPNEIWIDKGREFYNNSMKSELEKNDIETYSAHNEGKSAVAERLIRALKNNIYKYMNSVSKNVYIDKLDKLNVVNKCNNTHHSTNWSEEVFVIKKSKNNVLWAYIISDLKREEIVGTFYKKELQKTNQKEARVEKVIKKKGNKVYVKWKGDDSSFDSWIDKKDIV